MFQLDEDKTVFMMPHELYCYKVMPFGLNNAGATYQRLMIKIFKPLIGQTMEVHINDIVVKKKTQSEHTQYLEETFQLMRVYNMKLNLAKCAFGIGAGKFLGLMVTQRGIEVNLDQIKVILETHSPSSKKELQYLIGRLAALGHFIARFMDKLRHFFLTFKRASVIGETDECGQAFNKIKRYLT